MKKSIVFKKLVFLFLILTLLSECGIYRKTDSRKVPYNVNDRVQKNLKEGRGLRIGKNINVGMGGVDGGNFLFATSNSLWRATLEKLDFIPLANVDYAGGVIITDWYGDTESNEEIKVEEGLSTFKIQKSVKGFKLLHPLDHDFYTACRDKLNWSLSKDEK